MPTLRLTKHHGLGNDFLVLLDPEGTTPLTAELALAVCDRRRGIGADGLIRATAGRDGADVTFELRNADGSEAEMSGNGIRCLAQAVVDAGMADGPRLRVATPAGVRAVWVGPEAAPGLRRVRVDMGTAVVEELGEGVARISMGNPHSVVLVDDLSTLPFADPTRNVEFVLPGPEPDAIRMRVVERGVGETQACGTGACAAAVAAARWRLVGDRVRVHQPGGEALVELDGEAVQLTGPAQLVAAVEMRVP